MILFHACDIQCHNGVDPQFLFLACNFLSATTDQEMPKEDELHKESTCRRCFSLGVAVLVDSFLVYSLARNY